MGSKRGRSQKERVEGKGEGKSVPPIRRKKGDFTEKKNEKRLKRRFQGRGTKDSLSYKNKTSNLDEGV